MAFFFEFNVTIYLLKLSVWIAYDVSQLHGCGSLKSDVEIQITYELL